MICHSFLKTTVSKKNKKLYIMNYEQLKNLRGYYFFYFSSEILRKFSENLLLKFIEF